jgi:hypothetical protein
VSDSPKVGLLNSLDFAAGGAVEEVVAGAIELVQLVKREAGPVEDEAASGAAPQLKFAGITPLAYRRLVGKGTLFRPADKAGGALGPGCLHPQLLLTGWGPTAWRMAPSTCSGAILGMHSRQVHCGIR